MQKLPLKIEININYCGRRRRRREVPEGIPRYINVDPNILCNDRIKQQRPNIGELSIALNKCYLTTRYESYLNTF